MRVTMTTPASMLAANAQARTMTGLVVPYGQPGNTNAGRLTIRAGAVQVPDNLRHVKLFRDHDRTRPVGYATAASDSPAGLSMTFRIGATDDGNVALLEASEGLRDAFSVELDDIELDGHDVTAAVLTAVAQVPLPAFSAARVAQVAASQASNPDPVVSAPDAPIPPQDPTNPDDDLDDDDLDDDDLDDDDQDDDDTATDPLKTLTTEETPPMTTANAARPRPTVAAGGATHTRPRTGPAVRTVLDAAGVIAAACRGEISKPAMEAALADLTVDNASGGQALTPQWVGNLWTDDPAPRPHIDAITGPRPLTALRVYGFVWGPGLDVNKWAAHKTQIPTNAPKATQGEAFAQPWAGGVDVDRVFVDMGDAGVIADLLAQARDDYREKTDADVLDQLLAGATDAGTAPTAVALIGSVVSRFRRKGRLSSLFVGSDVWADLAGMTGQNMLTGSLTFNDGNLGGVTWTYDPDLDPAAVLGLDKRAATFWEKGPITVDALNIAQGGIDQAVHGYTALLLNRAQFVVTGELAAAPGGATRKSTTPAK